MKKRLLSGVLLVALFLSIGVWGCSGISFPRRGAKAIPPQFLAWGTVFPSDADQAIPAGWVQRPPEDMKVNFGPSWQAKVNRSMPPLTPRQKALGYVPFVRYYLDLVYPDTAPLAEELNTEMKLFASPGEYEPSSFSIRALKDLKGVRVSLNDLRGPGRNVIRGENIDIRVVRFIPTKIAGEKKEYIVMPRFLEKRDSVDISADSTRQFWITVYVPGGARPDDYVGDVTVESENAPPTTLKLILKVLPIRLETPPVQHFMYNRWWEEEDFEKILTDMREHGMTSIQVISDWTYPEIKFEGDRVVSASVDAPALTSLMQAYLKVGMAGPIVYNVSNPPTAVGAGQEPRKDDSLQTYKTRLEESTTTNSNFRLILSALAQGFREKEWPEIVFNVGSESDQYPFRVVLAHHQAKLTRETAPQVRLYSEITLPENSEVFEPYADIRLFSSFMSTDSGAIERTKQAGRELWFSGGSSRFGMEPKADRVFRGLGSTKVGAKGVTEWVYSFRGDHRWGPTRQHTDLVENSHYGPLLEYTYEAPDGPLPSIGWEGTREGIDDARYVHTLRKWIERANISGNAAAIRQATESERYVSGMLESLDMTTIKEYRGFPLRRGADKLSAEALGEFRWGVAQRIVQLQGLLQGK